MFLTSLVIFAWIPFRLASGFASGLACDAILVTSWFLLHIRDKAAFGVQFHWQIAPIYGICGYMLYRASCIVLHSPSCSLNTLRAACRNISPFLTLRVCVLAPIQEEITWRLVAQAFLASLFGPVVAVMAVAILFTAWHRTVLCNASQTIELFLFSAILGASMAITSDPLLPISLHAVRNLFVLTGYHANVVA
jgi:membrane protease YdiL (CAAX protease family)